MKTILLSPLRTQIHSSPPIALSLHRSAAGSQTFLKLSPRTLEKLRTLGGGPRFRKLGRRVMYKQADLEAWADARACESTSDPVYTALRQ